MAIPAITVHADDPQFVICLRPVLLLEGGNDDDKHDPGGRTSRGIIQTEYNAYRHLIGKKPQDVWLATWDEIFDIYYRNYWLPFSVQMWVGLNLMYFDQSVNLGPGGAAKNVQRAVNNFADPSLSGRLLRAVHLKKPTLKVDGVIGLQTLAALAKVSGNLNFLHTLYNQDMSYYRSLRNWVRYGKGWSNRANTIYKQAVANAKSVQQEEATS